MTRFAVYALVVCGSLVLASCGPYVGSECAPSGLEHESLIYLDHAVREHIPCEKLEACKQPSGRTLVRVRFVNTQNQTAECQVKVTFRDSAGCVVDESGWMPLLLARREVTPFEHLSLSTEAADFTVFVRAAGNP